MNAGTLEAHLTLPSQDEERYGPSAGSVRVAWIGARPDWVEHDDVQDELRALEVDLLFHHPSRQELKRTSEPDVAHVLSSDAGLLLDVKRAWPTAVRVLDLTDSVGKGLDRRAARTARSADLLLAGSLLELRELRRQHPRLGARTELVRKPVDLGRFAPERGLNGSSGSLERFSARLGLTSRTILFAGPFTAAGGLDLALEAVNDLRRRDPEIRLAAVAHGPVDRRYLARCRAIAAAQGGHARIEATPDPAEIPLWYRAASVVCLPCREPVGAEPAKLAAAAGRPFVGSEVDPVLEYVAEGKTGFFVPLGDYETLCAALEALVHDTQEASRLGREARRLAELWFSPIATARQLQHLWAGAVSDHAAAPALPAWS